MTKEFILYISNDVVDEVHAPSQSLSPPPESPPPESPPPESPPPSEPTAPKPTKAVRKKKKMVLTDETRCIIIRKNGNRCMRKKNGKGCGRLCGTHLALFTRETAKTGVSLEEFISSSAAPSFQLNIADSESSEKTTPPTTPTTPPTTHDDNTVVTTTKPESKSKGGTKRSSKGERSTITYKGIPYVIDNMGNVFSTRDVIEECDAPRIIGKYGIDAEGRTRVVLSEDVSNGRVSPT